MIQFIRYAPLLAERGARVILECPSRLARLLSSCKGISQIVPTGQALPEFDLQCSVMSLPHGFGTEKNSIPSTVPYLHADPELTRQWARRFDSDHRRLRIGLVWAGRPDQGNDCNRSMPLAALAPLAKLDGIDFYKLQIGDAARQTPPPGLNLIDFTADLSDFADTAAMLANLDLLITVDTAPAHLAGAMGRPTWTLLTQVPDWRWISDSSRCPWYPTMRLFRQSRRGDWNEIVQQVARELPSLMKS